MKIRYTRTDDGKTRATIRGGFMSGVCGEGWNKYSALKSLRAEVERHEDNIKALIDDEVFYLPNSEKPQPSAERVTHETEVKG